MMCIIYHPFARTHTANKLEKSVDVRAREIFAWKKSN